ncbi:hypothetical protein SGRIM119S_07249 [Streptomyces griseorubiginosus]
MVMQRGSFAYEAIGVTVKPPGVTRRILVGSLSEGRSKHGADTCYHPATMRCGYE